MCNRKIFIHEKCKRSKLFLEKVGLSIGLFLETNYFWTDDFKSYNELAKHISADKVDEMLNEPIFCRENTNIDNKIVLYRRCLDKEIYAIKHILKERAISFHIRLLHINST